MSCKIIADYNNVSNLARTQNEVLGKAKFLKTQNMQGSPFVPPPQTRDNLKLLAQIFITISIIRFNYLFSS